MFTTKRHDKGFTLIELLVVIVLLGILSGIAVFAVGNARDKAIAESCKSQQAQLLKALDLYYIDNKGKWPDTVDGKNPGVGAATAVDGTSWTWQQLYNALVPVYLKELPPYRRYVPGTGSTESSAIWTNWATVFTSGDVDYNTKSGSNVTLAESDVFFSAVVIKKTGLPAYIQIRNNIPPYAGPGTTNVTRTCAYQPAN